MPLSSESMASLPSIDDDAGGGDGDGDDDDDVDGNVDDDGIGRFIIFNGGWLVGWFICVQRFYFSCQSACHHRSENQSPAVRHSDDWITER